MASLTLGTRGSLLALTQSRTTKAELEADGSVRVALEIIRTTGDVRIDEPLPEIGGKGLFTQELDEALLDGRVDLAVHSLKDLPTELPDGLCLAATPLRVDPRDVLVGPKGETDHSGLPEEGCRGGYELPEARRPAEVLSARCRA